MNHESQILEILEWLWDVLAEPVLRRLGHDGLPAETGNWPRVWWCPTGILSLLPIHAAGYHRGDRLGDSVLERVISTYTSTIRALKHSREIMKEYRNDGNVYIAAMPITPNNMAPLGLATPQAFGVMANLKRCGKESGIVVQRRDVSVEQVCEQL